MRILRDLAHSSRVLILMELRRKPASTLKPLAEAVGLTQQAVSGYMKKLEADGLVRRAEGAYRVTPPGEEFLRAEVSGLKAFADRAARELVRLDSCVAIAGQPVKQGERVGLFMERGRLVAFPNRKSPSWGLAQGAAAAQRDVLIRDLHGIVQIAEASLTIVEVPSGVEGGSAALELAWLKEYAADHGSGWWAALDEVGEGVLRDVGVAWEFEFAPFASASSAVARGVSPVFVGAPETVGLLLADLEAARAEGRLGHLPYQVVRAKRTGSRKAGKKRGGATYSGPFAQGQETSRTSDVPARQSRNV